MKNKGFTLIELLAVVIIIGVLGLITVPMTMGAVENARKEAFEAGARSVLESAVSYIAREEVGTIAPEGIKVEDISEELKNANYISGIIMQMEDGSIVVEGLSDGIYCANGTRNDLRVIKGKCEELDETPPSLKVMLNRRTASSITILASGQDGTSGIKGYSYSRDGINYSDITNENIYTVTGLKKNETIEIYVRVYNNVYDGTEESLQYSMTETMVTYTTSDITKPNFKISTSENSASTVKIVEILYPENTEEYEYSYIIGGNEIKVEGTSARVTVQENGEIIARIKTPTEIIENKLVIAGLDNTGPVANILYNETWEKTKKIKIEVTYEQTGLPSEPYSYDGGLTWTSSDEKIYVTSEKLTGKIQVRDVLGNITTNLSVNGKETTGEIEIGYIDNENPTCELEVVEGTAGKNGWYISDVRIDFKWKKDTAKHCENNECRELEPGSGIKTFKIEPERVTENTQVTVMGTLEDNVGNFGSCSILVKRDAKKPEIPILKPSDGIGSGDWHNQDYTITPEGSSSESGITYEYSVDGVNFVPTTQIPVTEDTTETDYYVRACNGAGVCSDPIIYESKVDKTVPENPIVTPSDGIESGKWHTDNFTLTLSGVPESISGIRYEYSTDGTNYTTGNIINITGDTSGLTYYIRACTGAGLCSSGVKYDVKLDKIVPSISAKQPTNYLMQGQNVELTSLFNIGAYGPSGGSAKCYLIRDNVRSAEITNNKEVPLGVNTIECEITTGVGRKASATTIIRHRYNATPHCQAGTYQNGTCYVQSNQALCGVEASNCNPHDCNPHNCNSFACNPYNCNPHTQAYGCTKQVCMRECDGLEGNVYCRDGCWDDDYAWVPSTCYRTVYDTCYNTCYNTCYDTCYDTCYAPKSCNRADLLWYDCLYPGSSLSGNICSF